MVHFGYLEAREQQQLCQLVQLFVAEKEWQGCNGLGLSDEMKVTIAGQACLLAPARGVDLRAAGHRASHAAAHRRSAPARAGA